VSLPLGQRAASPSVLREAAGNAMQIYLTAARERQYSADSLCSEAPFAGRRATRRAPRQKLLGARRSTSARPFLARFAREIPLGRAPNARVSYTRLPAGARDMPWVLDVTGGDRQRIGGCLVVVRSRIRSGRGAAG
jgi:hypothetical protein